MNTERKDSSNSNARTGGPADEVASACACLSNGGMLSIIMPVFNLGKTIYDNIKRVQSIFNDVIPFEIVPVDDGSKDDTRSEIERSANDYPNTVKPVFSPVNGGKGSALAQGLSKTSGTHILLLDGDLDLNPSLVWNFFDIMRNENADIVIGSKMHPESKIDYPLRRRIASFVYYGIVKTLIGLPVHDTQTGMKLFTRESLEYAFSRMLVKRFAFDLEVLSIACSNGYKIAEAPVELDFGNKSGSLTLANIRQVMTDTMAIFYRLKILRYYETLEPYRMPDIPPRVSIVIACPSVSKMLETCIDGIEKQEYPDLEAIVLPDEPSGRNWQQFVREIPTGKVRPAEKRNMGIRAATGEIVAFLDDDAVPLEGWLENAIPYFTNPDIGAVGGPAITPHDDPFMARMGGRIYNNFFVSGQYRRRYTPTRVCEEDDLPSCNLFVRKESVEKLGGFDTNYWPGEDTILCLGVVHKLKQRMIYDPRVLVTHHRRPLFLPHLRQIGRYARHRGFFWRRFPETSRRFSYMIPSLFLMGVIAGLPLSFVHPVFKWIYICTLSLYFLLTFLSTHYLRNLSGWIITWIGVAATHLTYGACFLSGLFSHKMNEEVKSFDHYSESEKK